MPAKSESSKKSKKEDVTNSKPSSPTSTTIERKPKPSQSNKSSSSSSQQEQQQQQNQQPEAAASVYQRLVVKKLQNQSIASQSIFLTSENLFDHLKSFDDVVSGKVLKTPAQVQLLIDNLIYHAKPASCPQIAFDTRHAHCLEGALLAAAALKPLGYKPSIVFLGAANDDGHALCVYQNKDGSGCYGSIGQSNFAGLRARVPVYESVRELVMSYFENYFSIFGERTLRFYSEPLDLEQFDKLKWETNQDSIKVIEKELYKKKRINLMKSHQMEKAIDVVDQRAYIAGMFGIRLEAVYGMK